MIKFLTAILLAILCLVSSSFAEIIKTNDIEVIAKQLNQIDQSGLIIFDVDDVLLAPKDQILQSQNKAYQLELCKKLEQSIGQKDAETLFSIIFEKRKNDVVDLKMPLLIAKTQSKGMKVLALTNCFTGKFGKIPSIEIWRTDELEKNGYHFAKSWMGVKQKIFTDMALNAKTSPPLFIKGIVFTSRVPKGGILEAFLSYAKFMPTRIVFVDNKAKHLESVQKFAETHGITFTGIEYTAITDAKVEPLNKRRAEFQFDILKKQRKWLSDEEADNMMRENFTSLIDQGVLSIPIEDIDEPLVDLRGQSIILLGTSPEIPNNQDYTKVRKTIYNKLIEAQRKLPNGLRFCLYEGYRSKKLQEKLFNARYQILKEQNHDWDHVRLFRETAKLVSPVINLDGSQNIPPHSTGAAIDIYLVDSHGKVVDMGIKVEDWMKDIDGSISITDSKAISASAIGNRKIMSAALKEVGFVNYLGEYWHWSYGDRYWAYVTGSKRALYGSILND